jgi:diphthine-ammonia ligase
LALNSEGAKEAAVLWTGGKDSALALYEARQRGWRVRTLVTFIPDGADFLAHPLPFMEAQAQAMGVPHLTVTIAEPFRTGYEKAIAALKEEAGIEVLVTGDISLVDGHPNWIRECSRPCGMEVWTPLWEQDRLGLLKRMTAAGFQVIFSGVYAPWFSREWIGREFNYDSLEALSALGRETGLDLCGEQGEYHTLVLDGPCFKKRIALEGFRPGRQGDLWFMEGLSFHLVRK